jgi:hypothetical protein
MRITAYKPST